jgi:serine phosphatase RsbU (regulator of sigma subunit)/lipopolysaccharide biosynthesis regulator YciM
MNKQKYAASLKGLALLCIFLIYAFALNAQKKIDSLESLLNSAGPDTLKVNLRNELSRAYLQKSPDKARACADDALALSQDINFKKGEANAINNIGVIEWQHGDFVKAGEEFSKSLKIFLALGDKAGAAKCYGNIGLIHRATGDLPLALNYQFQSLKLREELNDSEGMAKNYSAIGNIYDSQSNHNLAIFYHTKALQLWDKLNNRSGVAASYINIGNVYWDQKKDTMALNNYLKSLEIFNALNDEAGSSTCNMNIGMIYDFQKKPDLALDYTRKALVVKGKIKDNGSISTCYINMAQTYLAMDRKKEAMDYLHKALELCKASNRTEGLKIVYGILSKVNADQSNYKEAYRYLTLFGEMKDSLFREGSIKEMTEMQTKYETEKKEKAIAILTRDSEIQSLQLNRNKLWLTILGVAVLLVFAIAALFYNRNKLKQKANQLLQHRNTEITQQKKEITDSINYAKRIQESILPPMDVWKRILPDSFIFYRPKDIVSGDFYWIEHKDDIVCFAAVDCTGHGVPGALMSVVGFNLLTQAINEVNLTRPSDILKHLDAGVTKTLRQSEEGKGVKDGMDLSLCALNTSTLELQYAGAFNSLYYVSNGVLSEVKADKFPIGVNTDGTVDEYRNHTIQLKKGDCVYLYSDGYADQFGGPKGKKFKYNQLKELLSQISILSTDEQQSTLAERFDAWKGSLEQVDDVLIIGVRV